MSWAAKYIGDPWSSPDHDCWGFFRRAQSEQFGRSIPAVEISTYSNGAQAKAFANHPHRADWERIDVLQAVDGDGVLLGSVIEPHHVGIWTTADGGGVLHCLEGAGVVFQTLQSLRLSGWRRIEFYRFRDAA